MHSLTGDSLEAWRPLHSGERPCGCSHDEVPRSDDALLLVRTQRVGPIKTALTSLPSRE